MTTISFRGIALALLLVVAIAATGCSESARPQATGKGRIRGINAIATTPDINFSIEERLLGTVGYKTSTTFNSFDDLTYNFNFDLFLPTALQADRIATQFLDVIADTEYTVVLTGSNIAAAATVVWENSLQEWTGSETVFEVMFAHAASQIGGLDVYFAPLGTVPVLGQAIGSLAFGERLPLTEFAEDAGGYELILTAPGDPATIVFQSAPVGPLAQTRITYAIFDPDPTLPGNLGVNRINDGGASTRIADANFPSQARALHAALGTANFDGYLDSDFTNVVFSDIPYLGLSPFADAATGLQLLTVTPVGNPGATIHEGEFNLSAASRSTIALVGQPGALSYFALPDNARPVETFPLVRILNVAFNPAATLDIYVEDPGTPIDDESLPRFIGVPALASTGYQSVTGGVQELTITLRAEKTPIAAPVIIDVANGDRVDMVIVDTVDPAAVELVVFEFRPAP